MATQEDYPIAKVFSRLSETHEEILRQGYGWLANVPDSEAIARAVNLRERGYDVETRRPTFKASGEIAVGEAAILIRKR